MDFRLYKYISFSNKKEEDINDKKLQSVILSIFYFKDKMVVYSGLFDIRPGISSLRGQGCFHFAKGT